MSSPSQHVTCVAEAGASLGESTCWDPKLQCLWWIDIYGRALHRFDPAKGDSLVLATAERPGCVALREQGGLILAMGNSFYALEPRSQKLDLLAAPERGMATNRFNDGKTDRQGRFWCGSMFEAAGQPPRKSGSLYRLDPDLSWRRMIEGIGCSNGLAWSEDSRLMYHTDSAGSIVWKWDFDAVSGEIENRRVFVDLSSIKAIVDGATVDADGCYWATVPLTGKVIQYDPEGKMMQMILLPTDAPTCCEFGGQNLDTLFVTTGTLDRPPATLAGQQHAGGLFAIQTTSRGLASVPFQG